MLQEHVSDVPLLLLLPPLLPFAADGQCSVPEASGQRTPSPGAPASQHHLQVCTVHACGTCPADLHKAS